MPLSTPLSFMTRRRIKPQCIAMIRQSKTRGCNNYKFYTWHWFKLGITVILCTASYYLSCSVNVQWTTPHTPLGHTHSVGLSKEALQHTGGVLHTTNVQVISSLA